MDENEELEVAPTMDCGENPDCETVENRVSHSEKGGENPKFNRAEAMAAVSLMPTMLAAETAAAYSSHSDVNFLALQQELRIQVNHVLEDKDFSRCEAILATQAQTLNMIFNQCMQRALDQEQLKGLDIFMKQGLKAQAQCRQTIEALYALKNPAPSVVKQTNIANGPQQVNNGGKPNEGNELSAEQSHSGVEALEQLDGAQIGGGEAAFGTEQSEARAVHSGGYAGASSDRGNHR